MTSPFLSTREAKAPQNLLDLAATFAAPRVAIARALINDPGILYADEPTGNLDAATGSGVMDMLMSVVAESKKTLVVVTHDQTLAKLGDRRLILKEGKLEEG